VNLADGSWTGSGISAAVCLSGKTGRAVESSRDLGGCNTIGEVDGELVGFEGRKPQDLGQDRARHSVRY
jgi:hypothetical protein